MSVASRGESAILASCGSARTLSGGTRYTRVRRGLSSPRAKIEMSRHGASPSGIEVSMRNDPSLPVSTRPNA
jgi:hypothetical protein